MPTNNDLAPANDTVEEPSNQALQEKESVDIKQSSNEIIPPAPAAADDDEEPEDFVDDRYLIDPVIKMETRDFVYEGIVFLTFASQHGYTDETWTTHLSELDTTDRKHLVLYNRIATSLIREGKGDVCAVTAYRFPSGTKFYYAKNEITEADKSHVDEFTTLVRDEAEHPGDLYVFQTKYFNLMFRNCRGKLERQVQVLQMTTDHIEKTPVT